MAARRGARKSEGRGKGEERLRCAARHQTAQAEPFLSQCRAIRSREPPLFSWISWSTRRRLRRIYACRCRCRGGVIDSSRRRLQAFADLSHGGRVRRARESQFLARFLCVNITCWFKCSEIYQWVTQMVVLEEGGMLTGHNQYLPPDYLSPLPTTVSIIY